MAKELQTPPASAEAAQADVRHLRAKIEAETAAKVARTERLDSLVASGATIQELMAEATPEELMTMARKHAHEQDRAEMSRLKAPEQLEEDWTPRRSLLLNGQPQYGALNEFCWQATEAIQANDQAEYSRVMDLVYKALRTQCGDRPPAFVPVEELPIVELPPVNPLEETKK